MKNMIIRIIPILTLFTISINAQCEWKSFFPFEMGSSKFDVAKIRSTNSTLTDIEDRNGSNDFFDRVNNGYRKYDYLKDSIYRSVINLKFKNNICLKSNDSHIQLYLSEDQMFKSIIKLEYNKDDYDIMYSQYQELLDLVPERYLYTNEFIFESNKTKEKTGEGLKFHEKKKELRINDKLNFISIGYTIDHKIAIEPKTTKVYRTNEISGYTIEIKIVDLRNSKLTREGY